MRDLLRSNLDAPRSIREYVLIKSSSARAQSAPALFPAFSLKSPLSATVGRLAGGFVIYSSRFPSSGDSPDERKRKLRARRTEVAGCGYPLGIASTPRKRKRPYALLQRWELRDG